MTDHIAAAQDRALASAGDDYVEASHPDQEWIEQRLLEVAEAAAQHQCRYRGIADRGDGSAALLFVFENPTYQNYFTTGYCQSIEQAIEFSIAVFENYDEEEIMVNIFKSDKLFPNIRGVMLKEKRVTLTMSGKAHITEMRDGSDARVEIFFTDHAKSAVVNRTQAMIIADVYGPETDDWRDKPLVLFGEHGTWFGKETWGLRVDKGATNRAWQQAQKAAKQNGSAKKQDVRGDASPEAQKARAGKRPAKEAPAPFLDTAVDAIPFFNDVSEVEAAMAANGMLIPETEEDTKTVLATLNQYANLLADGTDAADAVRLLKGELAL